MSNYVHHIPGRVRVRVKDIQRNEARASSLRRMIENAEGVQSVETNTLTGSVLIRYDPASTDSATLLRRLGVERAPAIAVTVETPSCQIQRRLGKVVAKAVISYAAEKAVERSVLTLLAAVL